MKTFFYTINFFILVAIIVGALFFQCEKETHAIGIASFSITTNKSDYSIGEKGSLQITTSSDSESINAVSGEMSFSSDYITVDSIITNDSIVQLWLTTPVVKNTNAIQFEGVLFNPGFKGDKGLVMTVNFTVKKKGFAEWKFISGAILANDGKGTNIIKGLPSLVVGGSSDTNSVNKNITSGSLLDRVSGKILLQVESKGEAWYVYPVTKKRFYLKDGPVAYEALRNFGLGITNSDLSKIPIGTENRFKDADTDNDGLSDKLEEALKTSPTQKDTDGDGISDGDEALIKNTNPIGSGSLIYDTKLINRLSGRILLQVESRGEAWYINPADQKRYYMKDGSAAYSIMRFLSLGITTSDLNTILVENSMPTSSSVSDNFEQKPVPTDSKIVFTKFLTEGSIDEEVRLLQTFLQKIGFFPANTNPSAIYGKVTVDAVADFQRARGISVTGYVGPKTREILNKEYIK